MLLTWAALDDGRMLSLRLTRWWEKGTSVLGLIVYFLVSQISAVVFLRVFS